jgi:hypothetical protein
MAGQKAERHGNKIYRPKPDPDPPTVRKVPADSVPFGDSISINGKTVWAAYDARGTLIAIAATASEVRRKYRELRQVGGPKMLKEALK